MRDAMQMCRFCGAVSGGLWVLFVLFTLRKPQKFRNTLLMFGALGCTLFTVCCLFEEHTAQAMLICAAILCLALLLVPVMLVMNGVTMLRRESHSAGNLLSLILGIIIGVGEIATVIGVFANPDRLPVYKPVVFLSATVFYFSFWILAFVLYVLAIRWMPRRMRFDYVIIHGCGLIGGERISRLLANRLDKAIEIYHRCKKKPILIPSGGRGSDENLAEADAMRAYLLEHGIPEAQIIAENRSGTTMENLLNSMEIVHGREGSQRTALVSSNYHVYRCLLYASRLRFRCTGIGAKVAWYYWPSATLREFAAVFTKKPHIFWLLGGYLLLVVLPTLTFL